MNSRTQGRDSKKGSRCRNRRLASLYAVIFAIIFAAVLPEFRIVFAATTTIGGTVFEDKNYGGGLGRSNATASGVGLNAVRLELYNASTGAFVATTTTNSSGVYSFVTVTTGILYTVRVVSSTIPSARTGYTSACLPVQTFRTTIAGAGTGTADTARVGGEAPDKVDAA